MSAWFTAPVLTGRLVRLEPLRTDHAPGLLAAADDPRVFAHLSVHRPMTPDDAERLVRDVLAARGARERLPFVQIDVREGRAVVAGTTSYYEIDPAQRSLAIGHTWLGRAWWRTGLNTESKLLLLGHAFERLGAVRVVWHTDVRNERSQAAIARLGAVREGVLRKHKKRKDGTWRDTVLFSMTDDEWPRAKERLTARLHGEPVAGAHR
ncbi:MAG TPA: GNAT family protein [Actinopolymorphaceae bacterium]